MDEESDAIIRRLNGHGAPEEKVTYEALVKPQIMPAGYRFKQVPSADGSHVAMVLEMHTPAGVHVTFWPGETALTFATEMLKVARATASGLVLPPHKANPGVDS